MCSRFRGSCPSDVKSAGHPEPGFPIPLSGSTCLLYTSIIHCHDWQTGLVPVYLKDRFHDGEFYRNMKSVITIHNLKFQGVWDIKTVQDLSLIHI